MAIRAPAARDMAERAAELVQVRLKKAQELLRDPTLSVADAARGAGFANANYLAKFFRRKTGKTPSAYRGQTRRQTRKTPAASP